MEKKPSAINIKNKKASFDYEFVETYTAGIVLTGTEIKSIRLGKMSLVDTYCYFVGGELWVKNMNIAAGGEESGFHHCPRAPLYQRERAGEGRHSLGARKEGVRQASVHQREGRSPGDGSYVQALSHVWHRIGR